MANALTPSAKKAFLDAEIDLLDDTIKVAAMAGTYTYSAAHEFYDDVSAHVIGTPATLASKTTTGGTFAAGNLTPAFTGVGTDIDAAWIFKDTGTPGTSRLIAYIDTGTGFPLTQDGGNVNITWNGSGIFSI